MLKRVTTIKTYASSDDMAKAFIEAWIKLFGTTPRKESIAVLYAHNYLETGGNNYFWNWNIGNIKAIDAVGKEVEYMELANTWEIDSKGVKHIYQPPHPQTWFRSFNSLEDGVLFYMNFLRNNRYKVAWAAVEQGNPKLFAQLLKRQGYYTASVDSYIKLMIIGFNRFMSLSIYENTIDKLRANAPEEKFPIIHPMPDSASLHEIGVDPATNELLVAPTIWNKFKSFFGK